MRVRDQPQPAAEKDRRVTAGSAKARLHRARAWEINYSQRDVTH